MLEKLSKYQNFQRNVQNIKIPKRQIMLKISKSIENISKIEMLKKLSETMENTRNKQTKIFYFPKMFETVHKMSPKISTVPRLSKISKLTKNIQNFENAKNIWIYRNSPKMSKQHSRMVAGIEGFIDPNLFYVWKLPELCTNPIFFTNLFLLRNLIYISDETSSNRFCVSIYSTLFVFN